MNHVSIGVNFINFDPLYKLSISTEFDACSKMNHVSIKVIGLNFIKCSSFAEE